MLRFRHERFGGLLQWSRPRALLALDRELVRRLGRGESPLWRDEADTGPLSAPLEVHLNLSERCTAGCRHCYVAASPHGPVLDPAQACRILDTLARMRVFHVALGGGEPLEYPALLEVAHHARARGLVPNLTTSGLGLTDALARELLAVFGQINVSLDGVGPEYSRIRGWDGFEQARSALQRLRMHGRNVGINMVLLRSNFSAIRPVVRLAAQLRLSEVELLRLKPGGRSGPSYAEQRPTAEQLQRLLPLTLRLGLRHRLALRLDCSLVPAICGHRPDPRLLEFFMVRGCEGGNLLASVDARGRTRACSFSPWIEGSAETLDRDWATGGAFTRFRELEHELPEPCASCEYLYLCRGGCRAVAFHLTGDARAPDPDCPRVREWGCSMSMIRRVGPGAPPRPVRRRSR